MEKRPSVHLPPPRRGRAAPVPEPGRPERGRSRRGARQASGAPVHRLGRHGLAPALLSKLVRIRRDSRSTPETPKSPKHTKRALWEFSFAAFVLLGGFGAKESLRFCLNALPLRGGVDPGPPEALGGELVDVGPADRADDPGLARTPPNLRERVPEGVPAADDAWNRSPRAPGGAGGRSRGAEKRSGAHEDELVVFPGDPRLDSAEIRGPERPVEQRARDSAGEEPVHVVFHDFRSTWRRRSIASHSRRRCEKGQGIGNGGKQGGRLPCGALLGHNTR